VVDAQSTYHGNALPPLIRHLDLHSSLDPHSGRLHPEVESCFVNVNDIRSWFRHNCPGDL
jgi:hypothetical protein